MRLVVGAPRVPRVYYGWFIVAAGIGIQALQAALLSRAYGLYVVLLAAEFGWSKTVFSIAFSLQQIESGLLGPLQGWMIDRFGPRAVMRAGILMFGAGFMLFSTVSAVVPFLLVFLLMAVGSSLGGFMPMAVTVVNWFARRRATAMGLMQTGLGIGGFALPLVALSLGSNGWRATAFASGVIIVVAGLPLAQLMRRTPEEFGLLPDGERPEAVGEAEAVAVAAGPGAGAAAAIAEPPRRAAPDPDRSFTAREAMRTRAFWFISFGHGSALLVVSAVQVHLVADLHDSLGYSVERGALIVTLLGLITMLGQVVGGYLGDRTSKRLIVIACMVGHAVALTILAFATALWMVVLFTVLHGMAWGMRGPLMQVIRADYFGRGSFGKIMGFSSMIVTLGSVSGPIVAGVLADRLGNYRAGFEVLALLAGLGSIFWLFAQRPRLPERAEVAAQSTAGVAR